MSLTFEVFTLFPAAIDAFVSAGLLGKAIEKQVVQVHCTNYRDFTQDVHRTVDDAPFGGGAGMVIKPGPVVEALESVEQERGSMHRILLTPSAPRFDQRVAERLAALPRIALLCGRYEGIDDRVREHYVDECLSIGDFILGGGEVAALVMIEAISRLLDGVLGNPTSIVTESFGDAADGSYLEHPQYTRPASFRGHDVPAILLGGNHLAIEQWRRDAARVRTWSIRPDLRRVVPLPGDLDLHVVLPAELEPSPVWRTLALEYPIRGLALIGDTESDAALAWAKVCQGSPPVANYRQFKSFRRRLGKSPIVIDLWPAENTHERATTDPRVVLDALARFQPIEGPVILRVRSGSMGSEGGLAGPKAIASLALESVSSENERESAQDLQQRLASWPAIADASRPPWSAASMVEQGLAALFLRGH